MSNTGKYITGTCLTGCHEGTKPRSFLTQTPMKTCAYWQTCNCDCHKQITAMFEAAGMPRQIIDNSEYVPQKSPYVMPNRYAAVDAALSNSDDVSTRIVIESPAPDVVPATLARTFQATPTGRAARGELELWVKRSCNDWLVDHFGEQERFVQPCTPAFLAEDIARRESLGKLPSTGAITEVFKRWRKIGFARIDEKPWRFLGYTPEGVEHGLDYMKAKAKDAKK